MDEQLKRRLVGAGIIVAIAVIVVPMFFEDKTRGGHDQSALPEPMEERVLALPKDTAPPSDQTTGSATPSATGQQTAPTPARSRKFEVVPLDDTPPKPAQAAPEPMPLAEPAGEPPEAPAAADAMEDEAPPGANLTPRAGAAPATAKPARTTTTKKATASSTASHQQPATAKPKSATAESQKRGTTAAKTPATTGKTKTSSSTAKTATPPPAKTAPASKTVAPDRKSAGSAPPTKPAAPAKPKAASPRSDSGDGGNWTVQAGTFVEESNARTLAEKLKQRNLPVRVQTTEGAYGKVYRVTVGPNLDRTKAEKIQQQLATQDDVKGMILQTR